VKLASVEACIRPEGNGGNMANSWEFFGAGKGKQVTGNWKLGAENW